MFVICDKDKSWAFFPGYPKKFIVSKNWNFMCHGICTMCLHNKVYCDVKSSKLLGLVSRCKHCNYKFFCITLSLK